MIGAIHYRRGDNVDALLDHASVALRAQGFRCAGFIQREIPPQGECCATMLVEEIDTGTRHVISQALGRHASGCKLDPQALARQAGLLLTRLDSPADLLIVNRFGKAEAEGGGLRCAIEAALTREIPVLVAVREDFGAVFADYAGDWAIGLGANVPAILQWAHGVSRQAGKPALAPAS